MDPGIQSSLNWSITNPRVLNLFLYPSAHLKIFCYLGGIWKSKNCGRVSLVDLLFFQAISYSHVFYINNLIKNSVYNTELAQYQYSTDSALSLSNSHRRLFGLLKLELPSDLPLLFYTLCEVPILPACGKPLSCPSSLTLSFFTLS